MDFAVEFYETVGGKCPVREFLDDVKRSNSNDCASVLAGLVKLRDRQYHRPPLSKPVGDGLFELRHVGTLNTRVLYFFRRGRRIILVHGIRHKAMKIPERERRTALNRMHDWIERHEG